MACPCFAEMLSTSAPPLLDTLSRGGGHIQGGVILEENQGYVIRRTILFDNKCGFVLGENPKAPNPYVTWQFNEQDGHRDYFWGHYHNEPDMAERDLHNRAEDYQRRYYVFEVEQAPDKETYKYYSSGPSTSAPIPKAISTALSTWTYTPPASRCRARRSRRGERSPMPSR